MNLWSLVENLKCSHTLLVAPTSSIILKSQSESSSNYPIGEHYTNKISKYKGQGRETEAWAPPAGSMEYNNAPPFWNVRSFIGVISLDTRNRSSNQQHTPQVQTAIEANATPGYDSE